MHRHPGKHPEHPTSHRRYGRGRDSAPEGRLFAGRIPAPPAVITAENGGFPRQNSPRFLAEIAGFYSVAGSPGYPHETV